MGCKASKELPEAQILTATEGGVKPAMEHAHAVAEGDAAHQEALLAAAEAADTPQPLPSIVNEAASMSGSLDGGSPTRRRSSMERAEFSALKGQSNSRRNSLGNHPQHLKVGFEVAPGQEPGGEHESAEHHRRSKSLAAAAESVSMHKIVKMFYTRVLDDAQLAPFFEGIDHERLHDKMAVVFEMAFGGRELAQELLGTRDLRSIHRSLIANRGLTQAHWDLFYGHFEATLVDLPSVPDDSRQQALAQLQPTRALFGPLQPGEEA